MKHLLTVEKDAHAEEICLHGTPESLRMFAKHLWAIADAAETAGNHHQRFSSHEGAEPDLTTELQGDAARYSLVHTLTVHGHAK